MTKSKKDFSNSVRANTLDFALLVIGVISTSSVITWILTGIPTRSETSDKLTYLASGVATLLVGIIALRRPINSSFIAIFSIVSWASIFIGVTAVEHYSMSKEHPMGFGWKVTLVMVCLLPFTYYYLKSPHKFKKVALLLWIPAVFVSASLALAFWQTSTTLLESGHSEYVINEILSPAAGYNTYQDFVPQYSFLLGWLIKPILVSMGAVSGTAFLVNLLTALGFLSLFIMVFLAKSAWPKLPWPILLLAVIPFCSPTPSWNRISFIGPASTLLSGPAIRIFGGMLIGLATVLVARKILFKQTNKVLIVFVGALCSIIVWNNLDFGLAATVASTLVISASGFVSYYKNKLAIIFHLTGQILGHLLVLAFLKSQSGLPDWDLFGWFARQFGGGFGSVTIEMPGAVNLDFPLIMGTAAVGIYFILSRGRIDFEVADEKTKVQANAAIIAAYFGLFSGFALPYYVNRSYHAGQMSVLYVPLATALIAACSLMVSSTPKIQISNLRNTFPALILAFMMATVILLPNPSIEIDRITGGNPNGTFPRPPVVAAINEIPASEKYANESGKTIGFYGEGGNYVHMLNGIDSVNIFNSPLDMFQSDASVKLSCDNLKKLKKDLLVMTDSAEQTFAWNDGSLCDGLYVKEEIAGVGVLGVRKK
jgi:hypothetical protein